MQQPVGVAWIGHPVESLDARLKRSRPRSISYHSETLKVQTSTPLQRIFHRTATCSSEVSQEMRKKELFSYLDYNFIKYSPQKRGLYAIAMSFKVIAMSLVYYFLGHGVYALCYEACCNVISSFCPIYRGMWTQNKNALIILRIYVCIDTGWPNKNRTFFEIPFFSANADRFSKFFHQVIREKNFYKNISQRFFILPAICCYTTLGKSKIPKCY